MIYRFRIILDNDTEDDIFRDIEIRESDTLEDLHNVITQSFGFDGNEMASFYISDNDWNQGEEFSLFDMSGGTDSVRMMNDTIISDVTFEMQPKLIYIYDFFNMWTFFVELAEIVEINDSTDYPNLMFVHGQVPDEAPQKEFEADDNNDELDEDVDINDYDDLEFDENWN